MGAQQGVAPIRVVLDTNVVISALLFANGRLRWLRESWQHTQIVPVVNQPTTTELLRVLAYPKFRLDRAEQEEILAEYLPYCEVAILTESASAPYVRDAADMMFLQLALTANVPYLVTGDADLLSVVGVALPVSVAIVTPEQLRLALTK